MAFFQDQKCKTMFEEKCNRNGFELQHSQQMISIK